jgi:co-chaperonin GroES (HSP10)
MVLIKPDSDYLEWQGFALSGDDADTATVKGEVIDFTPNVCHWKKVNKLMRRGGEIRKQRAAFLTRRSSEFPVGPEVRKGDRVFFSYLARHFKTYKDMWVVPYDSLVAREDLTPLNGYLLLQLIEKPHIQKVSGMYLYNEDANLYGEALVYKAGATLPGYLDYPSRPDANEVKEGDRILYDKRYAVRLEIDDFNTANEGGQSSLFRLHRKYVKWIY